MLAVATVIVGRGCGLLKTLLAPLPATLLGVLDGDFKRCLPAVARCWAKLVCLVASGVLGGDTAQLLSGVPDGVDRCLEG
jgi:hypothetical protein